MRIRGAKRHNPTRPGCRSSHESRGRCRPDAPDVGVAFVFCRPPRAAQFRLPLGERAHPRSQLENSVPILRRTLPAVAVALVMVLTGVGAIGAGASTSAKSLAKDLLTTSYAKNAGFTEVAEKPSTSSKTGVKSCPDGAQEAFEDGSNKTGVVAEVLVCATKKAAAALLTGVAAEGSKSASPPKQLGSAAIERSSNGPVYTTYWQHGDIFEFVGLETQIPASSTSSTTTTTAPVPAPPITAAEQKILSNAAVSQLKRLG